VLLESALGARERRDSEPSVTNHLFEVDDFSGPPVTMQPGKDVSREARAFYLTRRKNGKTLIVC